MENNTHTKGEWKALQILNGGQFPYEIYNTSENTTLAYVTDLTKQGTAKGNAEFICKAVNEYEQLKSDSVKWFDAYKDANDQFLKIAQGAANLKLLNNELIKALKELTEAFDKPSLFEYKELQKRAAKAKTLLNKAQS